MNTQSPRNPTVHAFGAIFAFALSFAALAHDGQLDTTYVSDNGYHYPGHGAGPISVYRTSADGDSWATSFLRKSDGSALIVGRTYDTRDATYGIGFSALDHTGEFGFQVQCPYITNNCYVDGDGAGIGSLAYSFHTVAAFLESDDDSDVLAVGNFLNIDGFFVTDIQNANENINHTSFMFPADFNDTTTNHVATSALYADGMIYIAGYFKSSPGDEDCFVARLNKPAHTIDWVPDTTYGVHGISKIPFDVGGDKNDECNGLAIGADGKITVVGTVSTGSFNKNAGVARLNANGVLDSTFSTDGRQTVDYFGGFYVEQRSFGYAIALRDDGSAIIGGAAYRPAQGAYTAAQWAAVTRLASNGSFVLGSEFGHGSSITDNAFVAGDGATVLFNYFFQGFTTSSDVRAITIQPNGRILLAGIGTNGDTEFFGISRLAPNGDPDISFGNPGGSPGKYDSTHTYSFITGIDSYTVPFGVTANNHDEALGILNAKEGIYVFGTSTLPNSTEHDFGFIRLHNEDAIFANSFGKLPPGG